MLCVCRFRSYIWLFSLFMLSLYCWAFIVVRSNNETQTTIQMYSRSLFSVTSVDWSWKNSFRLAAAFTNYDTVCKNINKNMGSLKKIICRKTLINTAVFFIYFFIIYSYRTFVQPYGTASARQTYSCSVKCTTAPKYWHNSPPSPNYCMGSKMRILALSLNDSQFWADLVRKPSNYLNHFLNLVCSDDLVMSWPYVVQIVYDNW